MTVCIITVSCSRNDSDTIDTTAGDKEVVDTDNTETEPVRPKDHVVADRETVTSIAAMYDITPSELVQTNKLGMSRMVFPGQVSQTDTDIITECPRLTDKVYSHSCPIFFDTLYKTFYQ